MRSHPLISRFSLLFVLVASSGCNTAYREAMAQAKEAAVRGDFMTAARAYRSACAAAPDDKDACGRFPIFAQKATDQALESARPPCEAGELDRCLPPLVAAKDLIPDHVEVNALLVKASKLHVERCSKWQAEGPLSTAVAGLACLQSRGHQLPVTSYQTLITESAARLAARFAELATTARNESSHGASTVLMSTAQCLSPGSETASRTQQARQSFLVQSSIPVLTHLDGRMSPRIANSLSDLCERMSSKLPSWARCVASTGTQPGQPDVFQVWVDALIQRAVQTVSEDVQNLDYISGTRQVSNPEYDRAQERVEHAERALRRAEKEKEKKAAECESEKHSHEASCVGCPKPSDKKTACEEADKAADEYVSCSSELSAARQNLSDTPETVLEDVHDTFTYSVFSYQWSSDYRFTLQSSTPSSEPSGGAGSLRFQDEEHVGFRPAGLSADPLVVPNEQAYADAFVSQLTPYVVAAVKRDAEARGAWRRSQCNTLPADWSTPWVQCWAESALWSVGQEPHASEFLNILATSAGATSMPVCR
ncbi:hypothetical protein ACN28E_44150 [Archangium lansingense]|uniref:hypothetical protein n=1 Tax=Archangium lansingense TaxID=2995310 RepID=UPI003B76FA2E